MHRGYAGSKTLLCLIIKKNNMEEKKKQLEELKSKLTGEMFHDMEIKDSIHNLEMQIKGVKPTDSHFDCIGCGS